MSDPELRASFDEHRPGSTKPLGREKVAAALGPGGALATVTTFHVSNGSQDFFTRAQDCYQRLLACIAALIDEDYVGSISKRYLCELRVARRAAG